MSDKDDLSRIEKLKRELYSRNRKEGESKRSRLSSDNLGVKRSWDDKSDSNPNNKFFNKESIKENMAKKNKKWGITKIFFWGAVVFFIISIIIAASVLFSGGTTVSSDKIDISVSGPSRVNGGEPVDFQISIKNNNATDIELADLIVEFPQGTRSAENLNEELPRVRKSLGDISQGETVKEVVKAILFGEEDDDKQIKVVVEYRVENSNAIFFTEEEYTLTISSSPVSVSVESVEEVSSGNNLELQIEVASNSPTIVEDVILKIEYPFGFRLEDSSQSPDFGENIWRLGSIAPGGKKNLSIEGTIEGQDDEERIFRIVAGVEGEEGVEDLQAIFSSIQHSILITKPFVSLDMAINGDLSTLYTADPNENIDIEVSWRNNLSDPVSNAEINLTVNGEIIDEETIEVRDGFYRSIDNTVVWTKSDNPELELLDPGQSGTVSFRFRPLNQTERSFNNPEVDLVAGVRGRRVSESQVSEEVVAESTRTIRFTTEAALSGRIVYSTGPFTNSGSIPPKAEEPTTYTVIWSITNASNDIVDAQITADLPPYVSWLGVTNPSGENISFSATRSEVIWDVGQIEKGVGTRTDPREVAFQIEFLPSLSQVGSEPVLVGQSTLVGEDSFTGAAVRATKRAMTTRILTDPTYSSGDERVTN